METSFIHFKIDAELKKSLQIQALKENKTLTDLLTDLIKDYLSHMCRISYYYYKCEFCKKNKNKK